MATIGMGSSRDLIQKNKKISDILTIVAIIVFFVAFLSTGFGLMNFVGNPYGAFGIALIILIFSIICFRILTDPKEESYKTIAFWAFLFFAGLNVIGNFNFYYPKYMAKPIVSDEIDKQLDNGTSNNV